MALNEEKIRLLIHVAKMYYVENKTQNEIANILDVSRPLISKYLSDCKDLGIVKIQVQDILMNNEDQLENLKTKYGIKGGVVVPYNENEDAMNKILDDRTIHFILDDINDYKTIGIGWGSTIGNVILKMDHFPQKLKAELVPLIGNAPTSNRNYHTNELVRMFAEKTKAKPFYIYTPVICSGTQERDVLMCTEAFKIIEEKWDQVDYVIVNIRNHPSVPDLASVARFGNRLTKEKAVGMILGYYFDIHGKMIESDEDFAIQAPLNVLRNAKKVVGIASSRVNSAAIIGALKTGLITHLIVDSVVAEKIVK